MYVHAQVAGEPRVAWLTEQLAAVGLSGGTSLPNELPVGATCLAQVRPRGCRHAPGLTVAPL